MAAEFGDWLALTVKFVVLCVALAVVMGLARLVGNAWWMLGAPFFVGVALFFAFAGPYLQTTHRVYDPALAGSVKALEAKAGVRHVPVRIVDVSSDTSLPNRLTKPRVGRSDRNSSLSSE